jgi:hypothetical protein
MALTKVTGDMTSGIADESGLASVQYFTLSGTWTKPSGITKVIVEVQGAGGSGVRASTTPKANSGGGGGYSRKLVDVSSISTATVTVGAGGAGSTTIDGMGGDGGDSIWSDGTNTLTGSGGAKGTSTDYTPGLGGTASGGDLNISGGIGGMTSSPIGGSSILGYGGQRQHHAALVAGCDGVFGGGGATSRSAGPSRGGNGGDGIVIVTEYK